MKSTLTDETALLQAALEGLELQKGRLEQQIIAVRTRLGIQPKRRGRPPKTSSALASLAPATPAAVPTSGKRDLSPAARKRIAEAQKKRWAEHRKAKAKAASKKTAEAPAEG